MDCQTPTREAVAGQLCHQTETEARSADDAGSPWKRLPRPRYSLPRHELPPVPDLDNRRFCRACEAPLPIAQFPPGKRRYLCSRHLWLRVKRPSKQRALADPRRRLVDKLWKRCWEDAKTVFGHPRVALRQRDVASVLFGPGVGDGVGEGVGFGAARPHGPAVEKGTASGIGQGAEICFDGGIEEGIEEGITKGTDPAIALLPADPAQLLARDNLAVVGNTARRRLLRAYRQGGGPAYASALEQLQALRGCACDDQVSTWTVMDVT